MSGSLEAMKKESGFSLFELLVASVIGLLCAFLVSNGIQILFNQKKSISNYQAVKEEQRQGLYFLRHYVSRALDLSIDTDATQLGLSNSPSVSKGGVAAFDSSAAEIVSNSSGPANRDYYYPIAKFWMEKGRTLDRTDLPQVPVAIYFKGAKYPSDSVTHQSGQLIIYIGEPVKDSNSADFTFDPEKLRTNGLIVDNIVDFKVHPEGFKKTATGVTFSFLFRHFLPGNKIEQWCPEEHATTLHCTPGAFKDIPAWIHIPLKNNYNKPDDIGHIPRAIYFFQPQREQ